MKIRRILIHGFALGCINFGALIAGFMVYHLVRPAPQIAVQVPAALAANVVGFALWMMLTRRFAPQGMRLGDFEETVWVAGAALPLAAITFTGVHYVTQGYLTAFGNIIGLWGFQVVANMMIIVYAAAKAGARGGESGHCQAGR